MCITSAERRERAMRIAHRCSRTAKKERCQSGRNIRCKLLHYWNFFRKGEREISKSIRRICDGYLPLAGSRHNDRRERVIVLAVIQTFG